MPLFGVCLGHQAIGQVFGGDVIRAPLPMHGKMSEIHHEGRSVFRGLNHTFQATRYHSLIVDRATLPEALEVTAHTDDGLIMASPTAPCRCMACSFTRKASPPRTGTR